MTVATEAENQQTLTDVNGYNWKELISECGVNPHILQRFGLTPEMLSEEGEQKYLKDGKQGFEGTVTFDESFVVFKLVRLFLNMELYDEDRIDYLMKEVKQGITEEHEKEQNEKLNEIKQKAKELGYTPNQLVKLLKS